MGLEPAGAEGGVQSPGKARGSSKGLQVCLQGVCRSCHKPKLTLALEIDSEFRTVGTKKLRRLQDPTGTD